MNKKGAEMTIGTIVVIILALVVLVVLIYGFSTGWSNLWNSIIGFGGGKENVQTVVDSCKLACSSNGVYDYCTRKRDVIFDQKSPKTNMTCHELEQRVSANTLSCESMQCTGTLNNTPLANPPVAPPNTP